MPISGPPVEIPDELKVRFVDWDCNVAYRGEQSWTYRLARSLGPAQYVKISANGAEPSVLDEAERMKWARSHLPAPRVIEARQDASAQWLLTEALPGSDATVAVQRLGRAAIVRALARGLRAFHEVPASACPFSFELDEALASAHRRLSTGSIVPKRDFHAEHAHLSAAQAVDLLLRTKPESERAVVCHGDYCPPNVLVGDREAVGFVDLGELGVADPWWDLAVGTWSVGWNFGPEFEPLFLAEYGVPDDPERRAFYRLLYDVVS